MPLEQATEFSIIVVSHNTRDLLAVCLESVRREMSGLSHQVLVVDNASTDGSPELAAAQFPEACLIVNQENRGFAAANNQALAAARGRLLLLVNSDACLQPEAGINLRAAFAEQPDMGIAGLRLLNPDGTLQPSWGDFPTARVELFFQSYLYKLWPVAFPYGRRVHPFQRAAYRTFRWVDWVTGAAFAIRRQVYERLGGLPEHNHMYGEDLEYCWRTRAIGYRVGYCPSATATHLLSASGKKDYARWVENYTAAMLHYYQQHCSGKEFRRAARYIWGGSNLRQQACRLLAAVLSARRREMLERERGYARAAALAQAALRSL
jgi:GT2 family glycosyltransferase